MLRKVLMCAVLCLLGVAFYTHAETTPLWQPVKDEVYLQEVGYKIPTEEPVLSVAVLDERAYVGMKGGLYQVLDNARLEFLEGSPKAPVEHLIAANGALYVFTPKALHRYADGKWTELAKGKYNDACAHVGGVIVSTPRSLYLVQGDTLETWGEAPKDFGEIQQIASYAETIYCLSDDQLFTFDGRDFVTKKVVEYGDLPSKELKDLVPLGSRLIVGTQKGLGVLRGTAATQLFGANGLPVEEVATLARGFDHDIWMGTKEGAVRIIFDPEHNHDYHYFFAARWLPNNVVNEISCASHTVYVATNGGVGIIDYEPYTLQKKAAYYERFMDEWGLRRGAFVHRLCKDGEADTWIREISDNDIGWGTHYWAAQAFKYAATGDEQARKNAVAGFNAMKWSEEITPIDGFPARSIWANGETGYRVKDGSGGLPAEWHDTPDGKWAWKADTSSDETDAQYYYAYVFYNLVANDKEKAQVREHIDRMTSHIIDHGYTLQDLDGKPTVWGHWDPEYFNGKGRPHQGLKGLEALTYMRVAYAITGDEKYNTEFQRCLDWGYLKKVIWQKLTFKLNVFHSDDRLAFYMFYTLLQCEKDPYLRSHYMRSLERSYEIERIESLPWFNFIYGALTGNDCETLQAARYLRESPLDLETYKFDHSGRSDLNTPKGYVPYCYVERPFSPRESGLWRWNFSMGKMSGPEYGPEIIEPSGWLDAYWMARYYGMILPPETDDPELLTVPKRDMQFGTVPYDGPPMPNVLED